MPWEARDAREKNRRAVGKLGKLWAEVANRELKKFGDEGRAIRIANAVVKKILGSREEGRKERGK